MCHTGEHSRAYYVGLFFVFLYPVGVPATMLVTLVRAHRRGALYKKDGDGNFVLDQLGERQPSEEMEHLAAMYGRYEPEAWCRSSVDRHQGALLGQKRLILLLRRPCVTCYMPLHACRP